MIYVYIITEPNGTLMKLFCKIRYLFQKKKVLCGIQDTNVILLNAVLKSLVTIDRVSFKK